MKNNEYNIRSVGFQYNDNKERFYNFLSAVIKDYISADNISPDDNKESNDSYK